MKRLVFTGLFLLYGHAYGMNCGRFQNKKWPKKMRLLFIDQCKKINRLAAHHHKNLQEVSLQNFFIEQNMEKIKRRTTYQQESMNGEQ